MACFCFVIAGSQNTGCLDGAEHRFQSVLFRGICGLEAVVDLRHDIVKSALDDPLVIGAGMGRGIATPAMEAVPKKFLCRLCGGLRRRREAGSPLVLREIANLALIVQELPAKGACDLFVSVDTDGQVRDRMRKAAGGPPSRAGGWRQCRVRLGVKNVQD